MKLLANENFPLDSVKYLKNKGFDITAIGIDNPGITDREVMQIAINEERVILTFDRDYGELIFKYQFRPEKGVIYFRLYDFESNEPGILTEELLNDPDFDTTRKLTVVDIETIRQRKY